MNSPTPTLLAAAELLRDVPAVYEGMDDAALLEAQSALGHVTRLAQRHGAALAGELARRSAPELGHSGLAQLTGHRTPQALIQVATGVSGPEAARLVAIGTLPPESPLSRGVSGGEISVSGADAIRRGLGRADSGTSQETLDAVAAELVSMSEGFTPEQLYRAAADARNRIDLDGVARREKDRRDARYLRVRQREDGTVTGSFLLDQEDGALLISAMDAVLSPRRGGPRFVNERAQRAADAVRDDPRTNDQLSADIFADIIRLAVNADSGALFGTRRPAVHVLVTAAELASGLGFGHLEGAPEAISIDSVRRMVCSNGLQRVLLSSEGQPLDLGRTRRTFSERQRIALAARDGGCRFPGCARPPSYCEAHHVDHWMRDGGRTDVARGILLCKHHHMLTHNNGWKIVDDPEAGFAIVPPPAVDRQQTPRAMPGRSPVLRRLMDAAAR
jgi:hypothetical protein